MSKIVLVQFLFKNKKYQIIYIKQMDSGSKLTNINRRIGDKYVDHLYIYYYIFEFHIFFFIKSNFIPIHNYTIPEKLFGYFKFHLFNVNYVYFINSSHQFIDWWIIIYLVYSQKRNASSTPFLTLFYSFNV